MQLRDWTRQTQTLAKNGVIDLGIPLSMAPNQDSDNFRRTPGKKRLPQSCPTIKAVFGKLRNDLSAPNKDFLQRDRATNPFGLLGQRPDGCVDRAQSIAEWSQRRSVRDVISDTGLSEEKDSIVVVRAEEEFVDSVQPILLDSSIKYVGHWEDLPLDADPLSVEDDQKGGDSKDRVQPLAMMSSDYASFSCEDQVADKIIEAKMLKIAQILGISLEGRLGEMRSFIRQMIHQKKGNFQQQENKTHKKKKKN